MFHWHAARFAHMDEDDLKAIVETGVRILRRVPMTIDGTDEFFDHLRAFGCTIDGDKVWFPDAVIDVVLDRAAQAKRDAPPFDPADRRGSACRPSLSRSAARTSGRRSPIRRAEDRRQPTRSHCCNADN